MMTVHELARRVRIAPHVVRFYTQRGLLKPRRNARNDYREYAESDVYRLRFICRAKLVGFTLSDIKLILADADSGSSPCPQVRRIVRVRAAENAQRLEEAQRLQRRIHEALRTWQEMPDQLPDYESLCRLIDAVAFEDDEREESPRPGPPISDDSLFD